jgi:uncharacterized lipoprotein YmbA
MTLKTFLTATACIAALLMAGCAAVQYPTYYALNVAPAPKPAADDGRRSVAVAVRRFETADYIRQGRIVYRQTPHEIGFYDYHRWATDPGATITTAMIDALRSAHLFSAVVPYDGQEKQECVLSGRLARLDEVDYGGGVRVETRLVAELVNPRTGDILWTGEASDTSDIETRTVASVVGAMSHAVETSIARLIASMDQQVPRGVTVGPSRHPFPAAVSGCLRYANCR